MSGKKSKKGRIALCIVGAVVLALGIFLIVWYCGATYPQFYALARQEFAIPGLSEDVCPQGLTALPENEEGYTFAMSGYMSEGASRVYLIDEENGQSGKFITLSKGGKADESHFGGVACSDSFLYVACGDEIARLPLEKVFATENGGAVEADYFPAGLNVAFCQYSDTENILYVGEFYRPGNYETPASHHMETADGSIPCASRCRASPCTRAASRSPAPTACPIRRSGCTKIFWAAKRIKRSTSMARACRCTCSIRPTSKRR